MVGTPAWRPTKFKRFINVLSSNMSPAEIDTDAGRAYIKALGKNLSPHGLACEFVGTHLARWLGVPTFDYAIITLDKSDAFPLKDGSEALPGPAFVTRAEEGTTWDGTEAMLRKLTDPENIARLVTLDTWTRNNDRYPPPGEDRKPAFRNVYLSTEGVPADRYVMRAMDHDHCFTQGRNLDRRLAHIDRIKDERVYGLFPSFMPFVRAEVVKACAERLRSVSGTEIKLLVGEVPPEWEVDKEAKGALVEFICSRASFLADRIEGLLTPPCGNQGSLWGGAPAGGSDA